MPALPDTRARRPPAAGGALFCPLGPKPSCPLAGGASKPAPRAEGGARARPGTAGAAALPTPREEDVGGREAPYEAERPPTTRPSPRAPVGSERLGGPAAGAGRLWPGTEPPASSLPRGRSPREAAGTPGRRGGKQGGLGLCSCFFGGGSGQEGEGRGGGCLLRLLGRRSPNRGVPLSSQPRSYGKMACLPAAPPALALRRWLGLGLFVLLCLSRGKQERPAWERGRRRAGPERAAVPACRSLGDDGPRGTRSGAFCQG